MSGTDGHRLQLTDDMRLCIDDAANTLVINQRPTFYHDVYHELLKAPQLTLPLVLLAVHKSLSKVPATKFLTPALGDLDEDYQRDIKQRY
jgi:hypothetical protein